MDIPVSRTRNKKAYIALGMGVLIIGFSPLFVRWADAPGAVTGFYRMLIAAVLVSWPALFQIRNLRRRLTRSGIYIAILAGLLFGMDLVTWNTGILLSGATTPTLLVNTAPVWVGLGSMLIYKEHQRALFWFGLVLTVLGAVIVLGEDISSSPQLGLGTFLGLLAAIFYGGYTLVTQKGRSQLPTLIYFWLTTLSSSLMLLITSLLIRQPLLGYGSTTWYNFLAMGVIVQVLGWLLINYAQGYLPASLVAPTLLAQPICTAILAGFLLGESFTIWHALGGLTVISGVLLVHRAR